MGQISKTDTGPAGPSDEADVRGISIINLLLGAWLIVTPFWFGYTSDAAKWNQLIVGVVIIVLSGLRSLALSQRWLSFLAGVAGLWAIIAPFILGYHMAAAYWNEVIVGVIVAALAFFNYSVPIERQTRHTPA